MVAILQNKEQKKALIPEHFLFLTFNN